MKSAYRSTRCQSNEASKETGPHMPEIENTSVLGLSLSTLITSHFGNLRKSIAMVNENVVGMLKTQDFMMVEASFNADGDMITTMKSQRDVDLAKWNRDVERMTKDWENKLIKECEDIAKSFQDPFKG